jgi:molecular chaperone GrpE
MTEDRSQRKNEPDTAPSEQPEVRDELDEQRDAASPAGEADEEIDPVASLEGERNELMGRLQRLGADYQNYQKRVQRDIQSAREFANEELIKALLPVLDDMERALEHARENHDQSDPFLQGMQLVHDKMLEALGKFGVSIIDADEGDAFNPDLHSAMMQQPTDEHPPMTILQEVQRGYRLKDRTLRPAGVVVATAPEE